MSNSLTIIAAISNALTKDYGVPSTTTPIGDRGNWWHSIIREPFTGAWQRNMEQRQETVLTFHAVYACITRIASDVAKCRLRLVEQDANGIWNEVEAAAFSPVLRKPNRYQTRIQFFENWVTSKLIHGNTYVYKERDNRGVVIALYVLDPVKTRPLVAPDGGVYYELRKDNLSGIEDDTVVVPASEIIHDLTTMRHHPLCGVPPMAPAALAATHGLNIQHSAARFFRNGSNPGGVLTAPGFISQATADRLKAYWEDKFSGDNVGKLAVLGDGLTYAAMAVKAVDAQLIEQLGISGKMVCTSFNVPAYMVGVGEPPPYNNIQALNTQYYTQCLQDVFEDIELLLDEGLGLPDVKGKIYGTEFDIDDLLRMDSATMADTLVKLSGAGLIKLDEGRKRLGYVAMVGGDAAYMQQQNYSVPALAKRDARDDPFASKAPSAPLAPPTERAMSDFELSAAKQKFAWRLQSGLEKRLAV